MPPGKESYAGIEEAERLGLLEIRQQGRQDDEDAICRGRRSHGDKPGSQR